MASFECPSGFHEETVRGQLFFEDIDENSELWLIRMPPDIELSEIDKKKIFLDRKSESIMTENGKVIEFVVDACELQNLYAVVPQKSDNKLQAIKKNFMGSILISEGLDLQDNTLVKTEVENNIIGHCDPEPQNKFKKNKKRKSKTADLNGIQNTDFMNVSQEIFQSNTLFSTSQIKNEPPFSDKDEFPSCISQVQM